MPEGNWHFFIVENTIIHSFILTWHKNKTVSTNELFGEKSLLGNQMLHFYVNENFITDLHILLIVLKAAINFETGFQ